jgi:hypothetical protein
MSSLADLLEQTRLQLVHKQFEIAENFAKLIDELIVAEKHGDADPTASHGNVGQQDAGSGGVADEQENIQVTHTTQTALLYDYIALYDFMIYFV